MKLRIPLCDDLRRGAWRRPPHWRAGTARRRTLRARWNGCCSPRWSSTRTPRCRRRLRPPRSRRSGPRRPRQSAVDAPTWPGRCCWPPRGSSASSRRRARLLPRGHGLVGPERSVLWPVLVVAWIAYKLTPMSCVPHCPANFLHACMSRRCNRYAMLDGCAHCAAVGSAACSGTLVRLL